MYLNVVSTSHLTCHKSAILNPSYVRAMGSFYPSCPVVTRFSVPSIATFIVQSHFGTMNAFSRLHARPVQLAPPMIDFITEGTECICTSHGSGVCLSLLQRSWIVRASFGIFLQVFINSSLIVDLIHCQFCLWARSTLNEAPRHSANLMSVSGIQRREWTQDSGHSDCDLIIYHGC